MRARHLLLVAVPLLTGCFAATDGSGVVVSPSIGTGSGGITYRPPPAVLGFPGPAGPQSWAEPGPVGRSVPGTSRNGTFQPSRNVVCDRATEICYRRGRIDKSETEDVFGERAGDRADRYRDRYGRDDLYVRSRNVVCDRETHTCYKNGHADRSETREVFGKGAARNVR